MAQYVITVGNKPASAVRTATPLTWAETASGGEGKFEDSNKPATPLTWAERASGAKTVVVKYGGNAMINDALKDAVIKDIVFVQQAGIRVILVHGGGPEIEAMLKAVGKESRSVNGLRYTDEETMEIVQMVLCGKVNKNITAMLETAGVTAIGLSGIDGSLFQAQREKGADLGLVGKIEKVNVEFLKAIMQSGALPVISSVALGCGEDRGRSLNVNADTAAAKIAAAVQAEKLILMTDVPGILRDVRDSDSLISDASLEEIARLKKEGVITKGMLPKVDCCEIALSAGVQCAHIIDGRLPHSLLSELFTNEGIGTMIHR
ncbi:MAG: acetylglutamate kinase [Spirochaetaceae bacterium]|jgi:acetylglutamate kinase|nr:acetylglutamate kinase [Spirochaetaceae bacterium]